MWNKWGHGDVKIFQIIGTKTSEESRRKFLEEHKNRNI
jgi:hypothetical protein